MSTYYGWGEVKVSTMGNTKERFIAFDRFARYMWQHHKVRLFEYHHSPHEIMAKHIGW